MLKRLAENLAGEIVHLCVASSCPVEFEMSLCQHVYRRGGIYWWRKNFVIFAKSKKITLNLSLKVREPRHARQLGAMVSVEADKILQWMKQGTITPGQEKELLKRFIKERTTFHDNVAVVLTSFAVKEAEQIPGGAVERIIQAERAIAAFFAALAIHGAQLKFTEKTEPEFQARGYNEFETLLYCRLIKENAENYQHFGLECNDPERNSVSPQYEYFQSVLNSAGIADNDANVEVARRLWMRAQSMVLADTDRRYSLNRDDSNELYQEAIRERFNEPVRETSGLSEMPDAKAQSLPKAASPPAQNNSIDYRGPSLLEHFKSLEAARLKNGTWTKKTASQHRALVGLFVKYTQTVDATAITQQDISGFRELLDKLPKSFGKSPSDHTRSLKDTLKKAARLPAHEVGMSAATVNRYLTQLSTILKYMKTKGYQIGDITTIPDMRPIDHEEEENQRQAFESAELKLLMQQPNWTGFLSAEKRTTPGKCIIHDALYFAPLIGYYEMGRLEEVCGLMVDDIILDGTHPLIHIRNNALRRVKTKSTSERQLPIHPELIRLGFIDYVRAIKAAGYAMVFPNLDARGQKSSFGNRFDNQWVKILDAALPNARKAKKTFHSFRKGGNTAMINGNVLDVIRCELTGHKQVGTNAQHYKGNILPATKLEAMAHIPVITAHLKALPVHLAKGILRSDDS